MLSPAITMLCLGITIVKRFPRHCWLLRFPLLFLLREAQQVRSRRLRREEREGLTEAPDGAREGANRGGAAAPPRWIGHAV